MRVLVAFDKFKDSMSATQACDSAAVALRSARADWTLDLAPLSDGGEGFCEILGRAARSENVACKATGPRGGILDATLAIAPWKRVPPAARQFLQDRMPANLTESDKIAVVEMAAASGLALLPPEFRDAWRTSSFGTGQMIRAAAELGAKAIVLGVGGSATSDLGLGALGALGFEFRGEAGERFRPATPETWDRVARIDGALFDSIPPIWIACDVNNPLVGPNGAAAVFGPQKGLAPEDVPRLDALAARMAGLLCLHTERSNALAEAPGAGAAGGMPFGLMAAARAALVPGAGLVSHWLRLEERIAAADIVITGEGRFDATSLSGKIPGEIAKRAGALGKQVHVFAGKVDPTVPTDSIRTHAISPPDLAIEAALREGPERLASSVRAAFAGP